MLFSFLFFESDIICSFKLKGRATFFLEKDFPKRKKKKKKGDSLVKQKAETSRASCPSNLILEHPKNTHGSANENNLFISVVHIARNGRICSDCQTPGFVVFAGDGADRVH